MKNRIYVKFYASLSNSRNGGQRQKDFRPPFDSVAFPIELTCQHITHYRKFFANVMAKLRLFLKHEKGMPFLRLACLSINFYNF